MTLNLRPGLHPDIAEKDYHADNLCEQPSLSCSLAKTLISESPLHGYLKHPRLYTLPTEEETPSKVMDFGSISHSLILGKGSKIEVGPWADWRTKDARAFKDAVRERGNIPVLADVHMQASLLKQRALQGINDLGFGDSFARAKKEVAAIWKDGESTLRSKYDALDLLPDSATIFDLKITERAHPDFIQRQIGAMNYDLQNVFYESGMPALFPHLAGRTKFVYLFIESAFPFSVVAVSLSGEFRALGEMKFARAKKLWSMGISTGVWPGYADQMITVFPKPWDVAREAEQEIPSFAGKSDEVPAPFD